MRIGYLVLVLLVSSFLIPACSDVETPIGHAIKEIATKSTPFQEIKEEKSSCIDECSTNNCNGYKFISCETTGEGCKSKVNNGFIKGKCNVECINNSDCKSNEQCSIEFSCIESIRSTEPLNETIIKKISEEPKLAESLEEEESIEPLDEATEEKIFGETTPEEESIERKIFTVSRVIDGDTFVLTTGEKVRLICVDTPEVGKEYSNEATNYLKSLVLDKEVQLVKDISETDRHSRLLRYVYVGDVFVNGELVEKGYAKVYRYAPDTKFCDYLEILETDAKNNNLGIWSESEEEETSSSGYICNYNAYNCGDFSSHAQAQAVYEACGGVNNDIHKLDGDKDGLACESLP